jgi:hypothetical protein
MTYTVIASRNGLTKYLNRRLKNHAISLNAHKNRFYHFGPYNRVIRIMNRDVHCWNLCFGVLINRPTFDTTTSVEPGITQTINISAIIILYDENTNLHSEHGVRVH